MLDALSKAAELALERALQSRSARRLPSGVVIFPLSEQSLVWVGINLGRHGEALRLNPFVGIHSIPVMTLVDKMVGARYQKGRYATFAVHLGELAPDVEVFEVRNESDAESEGKRIAAVVEELALPWLVKHSTLSELLPCLKSRLQMLGGYPERYAAAIASAGDLESAKAFVRNKLAEYRSDDPAVLEHFEKFAMPFLQLQSL